MCFLISNSDKNLRKKTFFGWKNEEMSTFLIDNILHPEFGCKNRQKVQSVEFLKEERCKTREFSRNISKGNNFFWKNTFKKSFYPWTEGVFLLFLQIVTLKVTFGYGSMIMYFCHGNKSHKSVYYYLIRKLEVHAILRTIGVKVNE